MTVRGSGQRQSRSEIRGLQTPQSAAMFTVAEAGLADKFNQNMTQFAVAHTVQNLSLPPLLAVAQDSLYYSKAN